MKSMNFRGILPTIIAKITGSPRYFPDMKLVENSYTHNLFRYYEQIFGRTWGVRAEMSTFVSRDDYGVLTIERKFHTFESLAIYTEGVIRSKIKNWKIPNIPSEYTFAILDLFGYRRAFIQNGGFFNNCGYTFALAIGTTTYNPNPSTINTSITFAHDATGADILIVGGGVRSAITSATYNGASVTMLTGATNGSTNAALGSKASPSSGSNNVVINFTSSARNAGFATNFSGSAGTVGTPANATGSTVNITGGAITGAVGTIIISFATHAEGTNTFTVANGATQIFNTANANTDMASYIAGSGSSTNMNWTNSGNSNAWASSAVAVNPAGGATVNSGFLMFM